MDEPRLQLVPMVSILEPEQPVRSLMADDAMADLVESMRDIGLQCPIAVQPVGERFEVIYGHRRFLAARQLRWTEIRALVVPPGAVSMESMRIHENAMRESINPADEAIYLAEAKERLDLDLAGLMKLTRRSQGWVDERFALLGGDPEIFEAVRQGAVSFAVARELNRVKDPSLRRDYLHHAAAGGNSSRVVHRWVEEANASLLRQTTAQIEPTPAVEGVAAPPPPPGCHYCGGNKDPWNLEWKLVHTFCQKRIDDALAKPPEEVKP